MVQVNLHALYQVGWWVSECYFQLKQPAGKWILSATRAADSLKILLDADAAFHLKESAINGRRLLSALEAVIDSYQRGNTTIPDEISKEFRDASKPFNSAIGGELQRAPIFYVTPKGAYDTAVMIGNASAVYGSLLPLIPDDAINDTDQAGRCLAFSLPTAAGFHIARATESVIVKLAVGCYKRSTGNGWGYYLGQLRAGGAPPTLTHHLEQGESYL